MKTIIKLVVRVLIIAVVVAALYAVNLFLKPVSKMKASLAQSSIAAPINVDGEAFRDLNRNGSLDPYEDHRVATTDRVEDLLSQMTLEEKVGQMFHPPVLIEPDPLFRVFLEAMNAGTSIEELISRKSLTHFNFYGGASPENIAKRLNELQQIAERTRLGKRSEWLLNPSRSYPLKISWISVCWHRVRWHEPRSGATFHNP